MCLMKFISRFFILFVLVSSCSAEERHHHVRFVNHCAFPIRVYNQSGTSLRYVEWIKDNNSSYYVPANSVNDNALSARRGRYLERRYEEVDATVFVLDARYSYNEVINRESDDGIVLVRYDVSLQDFKDLDWEISFPPDERMKDIRMWPSYEEVVARYSK